MELSIYGIPKPTTIEVAITRLQWGCLCSCICFILFIIIYIIIKIAVE